MQKQLLAGLVLGLLGMAAPPTAVASEWCATLEAAFGIANQELENAAGTFNYDPRLVHRASLALARRCDSHLEGKVEIAYVQRGAELDEIRSVTQPDPYVADFLREYLDLSLHCSYRLPVGTGFGALGIAPRASLLLDQDDPFGVHMSAEDFILGLDPVLTVGIPPVYLTARYLWDLMPSYDLDAPGKNPTISDRVYFFGVGVECPLWRSP